MTNKPQSWQYICYTFSWTMAARPSIERRISYLDLNIEWFWSTCSDVFYRYHGYEEIRNFVETVQLFASMAYNGYQTDSGIQSLTSFYGVRDIEQKAKDKSFNPYHDFFEIMIRKYDFYSYDFIGFSLIGMGQMIALLSIIPHLNREHTHICIGGNTFSKIQYKIEKMGEIFNYVDSILLFEGEYSFCG